MTANKISNHRSVEIQEEIVEDSGSKLGAPVERHERVEVVRDRDGERRERIVEDVGAERRTQMGKAAQFIWLLAGLLEGLIGLRFVLKLIAANPNAPFARLVYGATDLFLWPFQGLTATPAANGMVLEISSLIAMVVYAVLAWVFVKLLYLVFLPSRSRSVSVYRRDQV